jgi:hypothetical protein
VVSSDGKLIVGKIGKGGDAFAADGTYCLDALTGEEIWDSTSGGSTAVIANGRVYTIGQGKVWCFGSLYTPDLNISSFKAPEKVYVGETVLVNVTVKNIGNGEVNRSFNLSLRANGREIGVEMIYSLNVSGERALKFNWTAEEKDVGICRLVAEVDPDDKITEKNPLNNKDFKDVVVEDKKSDLTPVEIKTADKIYANSETILSVIVKNNGKREANDVLVMLKVDIDEIGSKTINKINPAENRSAEFTWMPVRSGKFTVTAEVDQGDEIKETNERNNVISKEVTVYEKEEEKEQIGRTGGSGGGSGSGVDGISEGDEKGTGEAGAGEAGGMQIPVNESGSAEETKKEVFGFPFGNTTSGASGGGGTISMLLILLVILVIALFYLGYYKERRAYRRNRDKK